MADPPGGPFYVQSRVRDAPWVTIDCLDDEELAREMAVIIEERSDPDLDVSARVTANGGRQRARRCRAAARARRGAGDGTSGRAPSRGTTEDRQHRSVRTTIRGASAFAIQSSRGHAQLETSQRHVYRAKGLADTTLDAHPSLT